MAKSRLKYYQKSLIAYVCNDLDDFIHRGDYKQGDKNFRYLCKIYPEIADDIKDPYETIKLLHKIKFRVKDK